MRGLDAGLVDRLGKMLFFLNSIASVEALRAQPNYGAHELSGDRAGSWAMTVPRNWRMTFRLTATLSIADLDLEDYH